MEGAYCPPLAYVCHATGNFGGARRALCDASTPTPTATLTPTPTPDPDPNPNPDPSPNPYPDQARAPRRGAAARAGRLDQQLHSRPPAAHSRSQLSGRSVLEICSRSSSHLGGRDGLVARRQPLLASARGLGRRGGGGGGGGGRRRRGVA